MPRRYPDSPPRPGMPVTGIFKRCRDTRHLSRPIVLMERTSMSDPLFSLLYISSDTIEGSMLEAEVSDPRGVPAEQPRPRHHRRAALHHGQLRAAPGRAPRGGGRAAIAGSRPTRAMRLQDPQRAGDPAPAVQPLGHGLCRTARRPARHRPDATPRRRRGHRRPAAAGRRRPVLRGGLTCPRHRSTGRIPSALIRDRRAPSDAGREPPVCWASAHDRRAASAASDRSEGRSAGIRPARGTARRRTRPCRRARPRGRGGCAACPRA